MIDLKGIIAATINDRNVSLHDIFYSMKINNNMGFWEEIIDEVLIEQAVEREGITVSDEELQEAVDNFRQAAGLQRASDTHEWLKQSKMVVEDLENLLERETVTNKLREKIADDDAVERYFAEKQLSFDAAEISHIVVEQEGIAEELFSQIQEEESDFTTLARDYSIDIDSKETGGQMGIVNRKMLSPQMEAAVFGSDEGDVVGPIKTDMGYHIIRVEKILPGELNDQTKAVIEKVLFCNWLTEEYQKANIDLKLMELI